MSDDLFEHIKVGNFVRCNFPHMSDDPSEPSAHEHCALIVDVGYDADLDMPVCTMVHSSKEIERLAKTGGKIRAGSFQLLVHAITGRVSVTETTDRIVNPQQVVLLPVCEEFFGDLRRGVQIEKIDSISEAAVEGIRAKMKKPPDASALANYRTELEFRAVMPDFLFHWRIRNENDPS